MFHAACGLGHFTTFVCKLLPLSPKKIVITGGPSTGKTSVINKLEELGYCCMHEISRSITLEARKQGIDQLFITDPLLFSERILAGRLQQFKEATTTKEKLIFMDRGLPDVVAYMDCFQQTYGAHFNRTCKENTYDQIFLLPPWMEIHTSDNERYENYEEAIRIHDCLATTYNSFGYSVHEVPKSSVEKRVRFILQNLIDAS
jgi:predicted ATPase